MRARASRRPRHRSHRPLPRRKEPSLIELDSGARAVLAGRRCPARRPVLACLKITGDWQGFRACRCRGTLKVKGQTIQAGSVQRRAGRGRERRRYRSHHAQEERRRRPEEQQDEAAAGAPARRQPPTPPARLSVAVSSVVVDAVESTWRPATSWTSPDDVRCRRGDQPSDCTDRVRMHPDDLGKVIGRSGHAATALRTLVASIGGRSIRVDVVDTDQ